MKKNISRFYMFDIIFCTDIWYKKVCRFRYWIAGINRIEKKKVAEYED